MPRFLLIFGDLFILYIFALMGRASHNESLAFGPTLGTAAPFLIGWVLAALIVRGWRIGAYQRWKTTWNKTILHWSFGVPLGLILRYAFFTDWHAGAYPFLIVTVMTTFVLMVLWRFLFSAVLR